MSTVDLIRERLRALDPSLLDIRDDSHRHAGHAGAAGGGGHYHLTIVSPRFVAQSRLARQRAVLAELDDLMRGPIHALSMSTLTPEEHDRLEVQAGPAA